MYVKHGGVQCRSPSKHSQSDSSSGGEAPEFNEEVSNDKDDTSLQ